MFKRMKHMNLMLKLSMLAGLIVAVSCALLGYALIQQSEKSFSVMIGLLDTGIEDVERVQKESSKKSLLSIRHSTVKEKQLGMEMIADLVAPVAAKGLLTFDLTGANKTLSNLMHSDPAIIIAYIVDVDGAVQSEAMNQSQSESILKFSKKSRQALDSLIKEASNKTNILRVSKALAFNGEKLGKLYILADTDVILKSTDALRMSLEDQSSKVGSMLGSLNTSMLSTSQDSSAASRSITIWSVVIISAIACFLLGLLIRSVVLSIKECRDVSQRIMEGDLTNAVLQTRHDEIGSLQASLEHMRCALLKNESMRKADEKQKEALASVEKNKQQALQEKTDNFQCEIKRVMNMLLNSENEVKKVSSGLDDITTALEAAMTAMLSSFEVGMKTVQLTAASSEEMSVSISGMVKDVEGMHQASAHAESKAQETSLLMDSLSSAVNDISSIVDLIGDISGQTNLLALNASIEAARAGDAGRGFAVVSSEVKDLADQTRKATENISTDIKRLDDESSHAVSSISDIVNIINELNEKNEVIANVMDQQAVATREISSGAQDSNRSMNEMDRVIGSVKDISKQTSDMSFSLKDSVDSLNQAVDDINDVVNSFLA